MATAAVIEDNFLTRAGIEQLLAGSAALEVTASLRSVEEFGRLEPAVDLVVLDLACCGPAGPVQTVARLSARHAVLALARGGARELPAVLRAGALGLVTRDTGPAEFVAAAEAVARGALYLAADVAALLAEELRRRGTAEPCGLGRREVETLQLLAHGYTHGQIARRLEVAEATVNTYVKRIRAKLHAGNKAELTRMAIDLGYVTAAPHADRAAA